MILNSDKLLNLLKLLAEYIVFILLAAFGKNSGFFLDNNSILPNFEIIFVYYIFFLRKNTSYVYLNIFLFGIIIDSFNFLPLGLNSLVLLLVYKIVFVIAKFTYTDNNDIVYFMRENIIFFFLYYILIWLILSIHNKEFMNKMPIFLYLIKNIFYSNIFYIFFKKYHKI